MRKNIRWRVGKDKKEEKGNCTKTKTAVEDVNLYDMMRDMIRNKCLADVERIESRMLRRILWERAKGELVSMTYTYREESDNRTRTLTAVNDFITVIENYLGQEDVGGIFHE